MRGNNAAGERWARRPENQRAWVKERLAAVDPLRLNAWTDALDDAIAVLDEADRAAAEPDARTAPRYLTDEQARAALRRDCATCGGSGEVCEPSRGEYDTGCMLPCPKCGR